MGFPQVQQQSVDPNAGLPALAKMGFARARQAFDMGMGYAGNTLFNQANQAMGNATGGNVSLGAGMSKGMPPVAPYIPDVNPGHAAIDPGAFWSAVSTAVSASGEDAGEDSPAPSPIKRGSPFRAYNGGTPTGPQTQAPSKSVFAPSGWANDDYFTKGAVAKINYGGGGNSPYQTGYGQAVKYGYSAGDPYGYTGGQNRNPYVGDQNASVYRPPASTGKTAAGQNIGDDPPGYFVPNAFHSKSGFGKFAAKHWGKL